MNCVLDLILGAYFYLHSTLNVRNNFFGWEGKGRGKGKGREGKGKGKLVLGGAVPVITTLLTKV